MVGFPDGHGGRGSSSTESGLLPCVKACGRVLERAGISAGRQCGFLFLCICDGVSKGRLQVA